jgi:hypothetical protein
MNTIYKKTKKNKSVVNKKDKSTNQSLLFDKDILNAVQIMDSMREKYKADKNWNSVNVIRKFRDKR